MKDPGFSDAAENISTDALEYVEMKIAAAKLSFVEGVSRVFGNSLRILLFVVFCMLALMAFFAAAIISLGVLLDSIALGAVIVGGVCLVAGVVFFVSKTLFINPMVKMFSELVFSSHKHDKDDEKP